MGPMRRHRMGRRRVSLLLGAAPLARAYAVTRDEKYAETFVALTTDWISKHPLGKSHQNAFGLHVLEGVCVAGYSNGHSGDKYLFGVPQFGTRRGIYAEFLGVLLASLYDHQIKTEHIPMGVIHNKAVFEQRGFINIAYAFREFRESREWMALALTRVEENFLAQTTGDGGATRVVFWVSPRRVARCRGNFWARGRLWHRDFRRLSHARAPDVRLYFLDRVARFGRADVRRWIAPAQRDG